MTIERSQSGLHWIVIFRRWSEPRRRALEDEELTCDWRDLGDELHGARPGADHRNPLAPQVDAVVPTGRVEGRSLEAVAPFDVRVVGSVQLTDGAEHRVGDDHLIATVGREQLNLPF